jgi:ABC-type branched-subunit amino acid transport system permease subunit
MTRAWPRTAPRGVNAPLLAAGLTVCAALLLPRVADGYWMTVLITAAIFVLPVMGCGLLYGRLGIVTLFQLAVLGAGAWIGLRVSFATSLPFPMILLAAGAGSCVIGVIVSLPALRLSTLHFALLSLMAAGAAEVFFTVNGFPNGGRGFLGLMSSLQLPKQMGRPAIARGDDAYFAYVLAVVFGLGLLAWVHFRTRPGRAWAVIRQGDECARALGINVELYKVWALALSCFITGVGGALFAAQLGSGSSASFTAAGSVSLFAVALMGGAFSIPGLVLGGCLAQIVPALITKLGANGNIGLILFGVGLIATLLSAPRGVAGQLGDVLSALWRLPRGSARPRLARKGSGA